MKKVSKGKLLILLLGVFTLSFTSCLKDNDSINEVPVAVLTMVNGYTSSPGVLYAADNNSIQYPSRPLLYQQSTFANLFPGSRKIRIHNSAGEELINETYTFKDSTYYTSLIFGKSGNVHHEIFEDKLIDNLANNSVAIRFFHLSDGLENVNVYLDNLDTPVFTDQALEGTENAEDNTTFIVKEAKKQKIIVKNNQNETLIEREFTFEPGRHYAITLIGDKTSTSNPLYIGLLKQY